MILVPDKRRLLIKDMLCNMVCIVITVRAWKFDNAKLHVSNFNYDWRNSLPLEFTGI